MNKMRYSATEFGRNKPMNFRPSGTLSFLKKPLFQKRRWSCDFTPVVQKHRAISRQEKMAFPTPGRVALGLPSPSPRVCTDGRTDGRTLTSQPKFFASIHYQISLPMELRWRALPAGSAMNCRVFNSAEENCKNDRENDHASFNQINELIGYQNKADFCETWHEHSLDVVKPKLVRDFRNL